MEPLSLLTSSPELGLTETSATLPDERLPAAATLAPSDRIPAPDEGADTRSAVAHRYANVFVATAVGLTVTRSAGRLVAPSNPELADRIVGFAVVLAALFLLLRTVAGMYAPLRRRSFADRYANMPAIGFGVMILAAATVTRFEGHGDLWSGFGIFVAAAAALVSGALWWGFDRFASDAVGRDRSLLIAAGRMASLGCAVYYLPSVVQTSHSLMSPYDAMYSVHETLAPLAGRTPMGDSVSQYSYLAGWPLLLVRSVVQADPMGTAIRYLSGLAVLTVALLCWVTSRSLPRRWRWLAPLVVLPLALVKQPSNHTPSGSIAVLFSALPMRMLLPVVLACVLVGFGGRLFEGSVGGSVLIGLLGGLSALNNPEFGLPTLLAAVATLCILSKRRFRDVSIASVASASPFVVYAGVAASRHVDLDFAEYTLFAKSFGNGFGAVGMPLFGLWTFVFGALIAGLATGLSGATELHRTGVFDRLAWNRCATAVFFGVLGSLTVFYYSGRSVVSSQLQIFLLFLAPVGVAGAAICFQHPADRVTGSGIRDRSAQMMVWFPVSLAVAAIGLAPDFSYEMSRLRSPTTVTVLPGEAAIIAAMKSSPVDAVYFGPLGHVVSIASGRRSAMLLNNPEDLKIGPLAKAEACRYVADFGDVPLYVERSSVAVVSGCGIARGRMTVIP